MKKRLLALLLSALLLTSATACTPAPEGQTTGTGEDITTASTTQNQVIANAMPNSEEETTKKKIEDTTTQYSTPKEESSKEEFKPTIPCNGEILREKVTYSIGENDEWILHIDGWDEDYCVATVKYTIDTASSMAVNGDRAFLLIMAIKRKRR